jgi:hypothetical protein
MNKILLAIVSMLVISVVVVGFWGYRFFSNNVPVVFLPAWRQDAPNTMSLVRVPFKKMISVDAIKQIVSHKKNIPVKNLLVSLLSVEFPEGKILADETMLEARQFDMRHGVVTVREIA